MAGIGPDPKIEAYIKQLSTPPPPGSPYSLPVPGTEREGRSPIYRHWRFHDKPLLDTFTPEIRTFYELFQDSVKRYPNNKCLGTRPWIPETQSWENGYVWQTYAEVAARSKNFGSGIYELHRRIGIPPGNHGVGIWSQNRAEWQIAGKKFLRLKRLGGSRLFSRQHLLTLFDKRSRIEFPVAFLRLAIRNSWSRCV